jgi:uncharacterized protein
VVDALRGFALVAILLLHNLEHFDYYYLPESLPVWMKTLDKGIWDTLFFLFAGKSYAIFALLFGLTFYIQSNNQQKKGKEFRGRFIWRLFLLLLFGIFNSIFFQGDILEIYAVIGVVLVLVSKLSDTTVFLIAMVLMLQPLELVHFIQAMENPGIQLQDPMSWSYFGKMVAYIPESSFIQTALGNLTNGKTAVMLWNYENGRFFQTASLFMLGMLAGRKSLFETSLRNKGLWTKILGIAALAFIPLFIIKLRLPLAVTSEAVRRPLETIITSWANIAFMLVLVSVFYLLFHNKTFQKKLDVFSPLGRMSLSNYVFQSVIGSFLYYGFGLALYQYTGATYSLIIGIVFAILLGSFSSWWMSRHKHGPLETLWHRATWAYSK